MPEDKNAHPTSTGFPTTVAAPLSKPEVQLTFHQHLREQIRSAVQTVMEEVMREELTQFLGVAWGECSASRRGYRNGTYTRSRQLLRANFRSSCSQRPGRAVPYSGIRALQPL